MRKGLGVLLFVAIILIIWKFKWWIIGGCFFYGLIITTIHYIKGGK